MKTVLAWTKIVPLVDSSCKRGKETNCRASFIEEKSAGAPRDTLASLAGWTRKHMAQNLCPIIRAAYSTSTAYPVLISQLAKFDGRVIQTGRSS
jgi:hypothetical protein